jgi:hypothetical protein
VATAAGALLAACAVVRALPALADRPVRLAVAARGAGADRPTLLYLFQRADCIRHAALQRRWSGLRRAGRAVVLGVPLDELPRGEAGTRTANPGFPVRPDLRKEAERLMLKLGYQTTPVTVLLDRHGRPRLLLPPPADEEAAAAEERVVRAALASP